MQQTNRTILFKEINPDISDILTFINEIEKKKSLTDDDIFMIHERLQVKSFEEFMNKFQPSVFMRIDTEDLRVKFSQNHLGLGEERIYLAHQDSLFIQLLRLIEAKNQKKYILSGFSDMLKNVIPRDNYEDVIMKRNELIRLLIARNFKLTPRVRALFEEFVSQYDDGIILLMSYLDEAEWNIADETKHSISDKAIIESDDSMQISVLKVSDTLRNRLILPEDACDEFEQAILSMFRGRLEKESFKHKSLMMNLFLMPMYMAKKEYRFLLEQYEKYHSFYIEVIKKFWIASKPLMETVIGVKEFFEQYHAYGEEGAMAPTLVVANFDLQSILHDKNREKLNLYLETVNDKSFYDNTIWYAILPSVCLDSKKQEKITRERFQGNKEVKEFVQRNEIPETVLMLELLSKHRIITFLSFETTKENTFSGLSKNGMNWVEDQLIVFEHMEDKDYIVPCFPNFIVVTKEEAYMNIGYRLHYDDIEHRIQIEDSYRVWMDEIGIEAGFVAAGMFAACQDPKHLKKHYKYGVDERFPGVAYRFSEGDHSTNTCSNMISDSIDYSDDFREEIERFSKGIIFGQKKGKVVIVTERPYSYSLSNQLTIPMVQTSLYMERVIQTETQDFKKNLIRQFFQKRPDSIIASWDETNQNEINSILKKNESIEFQFDENDENCTFFINFKNHGYIRNERVRVLPD